MNSQLEGMRPRRQLLDEPTASPDELMDRLTAGYEREKRRCPDNRPSRRWAYRHLLEKIAGIPKHFTQVQMACHAVGFKVSEIDLIVDSAHGDPDRYDESKRSSAAA